MADTKVDALTISILGKLDSSLLKAIAETEKTLKQLNVSSRTQSAIMSRFYKQAFDIAEKSSAQFGSRPYTPERLLETPWKPASRYARAVRFPDKACIAMIQDEQARRKQRAQKWRLW